MSRVQIRTKCLTILRIMCGATLSNITFLLPFLLSVNLFYFQAHHFAFALPYHITLRKTCIRANATENRKGGGGEKVLCAHSSQSLSVLHIKKAGTSTIVYFHSSFNWCVCGKHKQKPQCHLAFSFSLLPFTLVQSITW